MILWAAPRAECRGLGEFQHLACPSPSAGLAVTLAAGDQQVVREVSALRKGERVCLEEVDGKAKDTVLVANVPEESDGANISKEKRRAWHGFHM